MRLHNVIGLAVAGVLSVVVSMAQSRPAHSLGAGNEVRPARVATEPELRDASTRAIALMQQSQVTWRKAQTCASCHHTLLPQIPLNLARARNIRIDEAIARETDKTTFVFMNDIDLAVQRTDYVDVFFDGWLLVAAQTAGLTSSSVTSTYSQCIASMQLEDGTWRSTDGRPPQAWSPYSSTAICSKAIASYLPPQLSVERESRLRRARAWLERNRGNNTEDRAYRLLGLKWTGAGSAVCADAARTLVLEQHADGGWSELPWRTSDAYSTGLVLYALHEGAALPVTDQTYRRGVRWLLDSQAEDGSWHVTSRLHPPAPVSPPYFESGFPYGHDQFVSMMGTTWATTALLQAIPATSRSVAQGAALTTLSSRERVEWIDTILTGSPRELERALASGLDPNVKTAGGTTALMVAARDYEKTKILVDHGADVNAAAKSGITPLIVAARFHGNERTVRLLLASGAKPNPAPGVEVRNDASAVYFGTFARDPAIISALLEAGAERDTRMKVLGVAPISAIVFAATSGDEGVVACLLDHGVDANAIDDSGVSPLAWAAIYNRPETVELLLKHGAKVDYVDGFGMTPLLYAASVDYGDTVVIELLIAAGADPKMTNREGRRPLDLARDYGHSLIATVLSSRSTAQ